MRLLHEKAVRGRERETPRACVVVEERELDAAPLLEAADPEPPGELDDLLIQFVGAPKLALGRDE